MSERAAHERAVLEIARSMQPPPLDEALRRLAVALRERFPHYSGVYVYWLEDADTLVLRACDGRPTEHARIPVGRGICGRAVRERATVIVDDVRADPDYLACSLETRSEIVVPIMRGDRVLGEIDIDGDDPAAYDERDRRFLEEVAALIAERCD